MKRKTLEEFISEAKIKHNAKYDYSKVNYVNVKTKVCIICPVHGAFWQKPNDHLNGRGCKKCYDERRGETQRSCKDEFIDKANKIHNGKYDYSKVEYVNTHTKVCIICPEHGYFFIQPASHLAGRKCNECSKIERAKHKTMKTEKFVNKAKIIHGEKYDYSVTNYDGIYNIVDIICPIHGIFNQIASYHLSGNGCQQCAQEMKESTSERNLFQFVSENYDGIIMKNYRKILSGNRELDIYVPSLKLAIEFDGLFWHSSKNNTPSNYHLNKTAECKEKGIKLIHIFEDEWLYKRDIVKSLILKSLNSDKVNKINADECYLLTVQINDAYLFLEENSIDEIKSFDVCYGLYHKDKLVAVMSFKKNGEVINYCEKINTVVIGGRNNLLQHFITKNRNKTIKWQIDRRWSDGSEIEAIGFEYCGETEPSFTYVSCDKRLTEKVTENKIYDCGRLIFVLNK